MSMTLWDWLASPQGSDLVRALTLLLTALAAYFGYRAHQSAEYSTKKLDEKLPNGSVVTSPQHNTDLFPPGPKG